MFVFIFVIVIIVTIVSLLTIFIFIPLKNKKLVMQNSTRIRELKEINAVTKYSTLVSDYYESYRSKSKNQFDKFDLYSYMIDCISERENFYNSIISCVEFNRNQYSKYKNIISKIDATVDDCIKKLKIKKEIFLKYEEQIFNNLIQKPILDTTVHCCVYYSSPKGRNHYNREYKCNYISLIDLVQRAKQLKEERTHRQEQIKYERLKMSDSLRYDILKRDNFRCQICGSTQADGVKLHVDHIIPVSKGGKTERNNLRTLCDRCNLGKSNKIE